jgi:predicted GNAT family acetyltransferase
MASHPTSVPDRATVADDPDAHRYVIELDGSQIGHLDYRLAGAEITMIHAEIDPSHGGQGLGSALVRGALDDARARGLRVRPRCPFVVEFLARHPGEYDHLVV